MGGLFGVANKSLKTLYLSLLSASLKLQETFEWILGKDDYDRSYDEKMILFLLRSDEHNFLFCHFHCI